MLFISKNTENKGTEDTQIGEDENMAVKIKGIVVKAEENYLYVSLLENHGGLCTVSYPSEEENVSTKFKTGQEIQIYFDGSIAESYPGQIFHVRKNRNTKRRIRERNFKKRTAILL